MLGLAAAGKKHKEKKNGFDKEYERSVRDAERQEEKKMVRQQQREQQSRPLDDGSIAGLFDSPRRPRPSLHTLAIEENDGDGDDAEEDEDGDGQDYGVGPVLAPGFSLESRWADPGTKFNPDWLTFAFGEAGSQLHWRKMPDAEQPNQGTNSEYIGEYAYIHVPVLYEGEDELYGIDAESWITRQYFAIYLRRFRRANHNGGSTMKHVLLLTGGPGYSGAIWGEGLRRLAHQYGNDPNIVFYAADHRGVHQSRGIYVRIHDDYMVQFRNGRERVREADWLRNPRQLEVELGYPLVAMSCSSAARDLVVVAKAIESALPRSRKHLFYLHAESYGTQVAQRALLFLPDFFQAVLLDGLATMELASETARADQGILRSCDEDPSCREALLKRTHRLPNSTPLVQLNTVYDMRKIMANLEAGQHNIACRRALKDVFASIYGKGHIHSFWRIVQMISYDLLSDDFLNDYNPDPNRYGSFYLGQLALPFFKELYYCPDVDRFKLQAHALKKVILKRYREDGIVAAKNRDRGFESSAEGNSYFVAAYINTHEAYDLYLASTDETEVRFCQVPNQPHLTNQCSALKDMANNKNALHKLTGVTGRLERVLDEWVDEVDSGYAEPEHHPPSRSTRGDPFKAPKSHSPTRQRPRKRKDLQRAYTYFLDAVAYTVPSLSGPTNLFVLSGSLDIKTPTVAARRYFKQMRVAAEKHFFLLDNVAHWMSPCLTEIIRAFIADDRDQRDHLLKRARKCEAELADRRLLDWPMEHVRNINKDIWW